MIVFVTGAIPGFTALAHRFAGECLNVNGIESIPPCDGCSVFVIRREQR